MRFRRHVPQKRQWREWLKRLLPERPRPSPDREEPPTTPESVETERPETLETGLQPDPAVQTAASIRVDAEPDPIPSDQASPEVDGSWEPSGSTESPFTRTWLPTRLTPRAKAMLTWGGTFFGMFVVGYAIAALVLFPAPIFAASRSVPRLLGLARAEAETRLTEDGLRVGEIEGVTHPTAARGQIVWQDPPAGVGVPEGTLVGLTVSNGPQRVPVPDLLGYDATIAAQLLEASGLQVGRIITTQAPVPQGVVVSTRPSTGSTLLPRTSVTLVVSEGAPTIAVPNLSGLTVEEAEMILQSVGLVMGETLRKASRDVPPGTIVEQDPRAGTLSAPGTIIDIFIARAPSR